MEIIVGRKGTQRTPIIDLTVSREHCKLSIEPDGTIWLENISDTGTFVDEVSIVRKRVYPESIIRLGPSFKISVENLLPLPTTSDSPANSKADDDTNYAQEFAKLKVVYNKYSQEKLAIQKEAGVTNFMRMLPMTLLSLVGLGSAAIPALRDIAPFIAIAGAGLLIYSLVKSYNGSKNNPERLQALDKQFMIDYVCPKCKTFLGFIPYESLYNKKQCSYCKCKWNIS
jgi:pSer/pThr/pTyr-binding forkhead associated (FHA) protein